MSLAPCGHVLGLAHAWEAAGLLLHVASLQTRRWQSSPIFGPGSWWVGRPFRKATSQPVHFASAPATLFGQLMVPPDTMGSLLYTCWASSCAGGAPTAWPVAAHLGAVFFVLVCFLLEGLELLKFVRRSHFSVYTPPPRSTPSPRSTSLVAAVDSDIGWSIANLGLHTVAGVEYRALALGSPATSTVHIVLVSLVLW